MLGFRPELETCPICNSTGNCHIHDYYDRSLTDFVDNRRSRESLCVMRVFCDSCRHAHAVLPDVLIPYSTYGLVFILRVLGEYFTGLGTADKLCEKFGISRNTFFKWLALWRSHKSEWLGVIADRETGDSEFFSTLYSDRRYSDFSMEFILRFTISFLQSHRNPVPVRCRAADCHQTVFTPDIVIV